MPPFSTLSKPKEKEMITIFEPLISKSIEILDAMKNSFKSGSSKKILDKQSFI